MVESNKYPNNKLITKLILQFNELEDELTTLLNFEYPTGSNEVHTTFINNILGRIRDRIPNLTTQFLQLYKSNEKFTYKVTIEGKDSTFSGDLLALTIYNNLMYKLLLKIMNVNTVNLDTKMLIMNRLIYDTESVAKRVDTVSNILYIKDNPSADLTVAEGSEAEATQVTSTEEPTSNYPDEDDE